MSQQKPFERDRETLDLFIEESLDALTRIERLLLEAEAGTPRADLMSSLFRDIHTIKGTSGFLALPKILSLAHAGEDLLAELRDGTVKGTPAHYAILVEVGDLLRRMIENVRHTDDEGDVEVDSCVARLRAMLPPPEHRSVRPPSAVSAPPIRAASAAPRPALVVPGASHAPPVAAPPLAAPPVPASAPIAAALPAVEIRPASPSPAPSPDPAAATPPEPKDTGDGTVRVSVGVLDKLMNLIGELVLARNQIVQITKAQKDASGHAQAASQRLSLVTSDLQESVMKTRMQPVARVFERIPRMVRDLSQQVGKQVACRIDGNATEIDKALVEAIRDPVMHIVRNAIDHGIESPADRARMGKPQQGALRVRAAHEGGMVTVTIEDDGRGMDPKKLRAHAVKKGVVTPAEADRLSDREALHLVFRPGFSTAESVTDISGRGVGMDVVRTHVERAGGQVELESVVGKGTTIRLKMPLTLAIIPALLVRAGGQRFAIPQVNLLELVYLDDESAKKNIERVRDAPIYRLRGEVLPLLHLSQVLRIGAEKATKQDGVNIVVVAVGTHRYGLVVDAIHDTEEIVIKPLHGHLKRLACYSGATVLGDGGVALILEVAGIAAMAGIDPDAQRRAIAAEAREGAARTQTEPYVVFLAGEATPCAVPLAMVARLENVRADTIERVGDAEVLQYRGRIMPIVRPEGILPVGTPPPSTDQPLVVFDFGRMVGMAVTRILDVVELPVGDAVEPSALPHTLGRQVVFGKTTLLLDVYGIVRALERTFTAEARSTSAGRRVLVVEDSLAMRAALVGHLRSQGISVVEAGDGHGALQALRSDPARRFDAIVTDLEMAGMDGWELLGHLRQERPDLPLFVWTIHEGAAIEQKARAAGAKACIHKMRREDLTAALLSNVWEGRAA